MEKFRQLREMMKDLHADLVVVKCMTAGVLMLELVIFVLVMK